MLHILNFFSESALLCRFEGSGCAAESGGPARASAGHWDRHRAAVNDGCLSRGGLCPCLRGQCYM